MTKLSELKVGDRFTVEAVIVDDRHGLISFQIGNCSHPNNVYKSQGPIIEVTKLPDPPRPLVAGERIRPINRNNLAGTYMGRFRDTEWVLWDNSPPVRLFGEPTTGHYEVLEK